MAQLRFLVVYYSRTGTTRRVAEALAQKLGADIEEIVDRKRRGGVLGFIVSGKDAMLRRLTQISEPRRDPASYDLVAIGTPVWAARMSPAVRTYISQFRDRLPAVAFFLTTGRVGIESTFKDMTEACGKEPVARLGLKQKQVRRGAWLDAVQEFASELAG
jgi:flavodoxin